MKDLSSLLAIAALVMTPVIASPLGEIDYTTKSWSIIFWEGVECTSPETGRYNGPSKPKVGKVCHPIPDVGVTSSADVYTAGSAYFGFHQKSDCSDDGGYFEGQSNAPECVSSSNLDNAKYFSVTTKSKSKLARAEDENEVKPHEDFTCEVPNFVIATGIAAGGFWVHAAGVCPASANDENINKAQCALDAVFGTVATLVTVFGAAGVVRTPSKRDANSSVIVHNDSTLMDGFATTITHIGSELSHPYPEGSGWEHYSFDLLDTDGDSGDVNAVYSTHEDGRKRITNAPVTHDGVQKRASKLTAYYGWNDGNTSKFKSLPICKTKKNARYGAEKLWNYGKTNNKDDFCANLEGGTTIVAHGNFAVLSGTFTDYAGRC